MKYLSLFSGIEAATVAWHPLGLHPAAFSEIDPFASAVLAHRFPHIPNLGDVTRITEEQIKALGPLDVIVFGSPCQDLSVAGKRKGFSGERSGLFYAAIRIVRWARKHCGLRLALWENVYGAFSSNQGRDFAAVVAEMAGLRDVAVPANGWGNEGAALGEHGLLEWSTLDAQWFGVAQRRRRVFAVADFGDWADRAPILLERQSLRRDTPPSRGARTAVAALTANGVGACGADDNQGQAGRLIPAEGCWWDGGQVSQTLDAVLAKGQTMPEKNRFPAVLQPIAFHPTQDPISSTDGSTHAMGCGSSGGQASVAVAFSSKDHGADDSVEVSPTLRAMGHSGSHANGGGQVAVAVSLRGREGGATAELGDEVQNCLRASGGGGDKAHVLAPVCVTGDITHTLKAEGFDGSEDGTGRGQPIVAQAVGVTIHGTDPTVRKVASYDELAQCLRARAPGHIDNSSTTVIQAEMAVRRLTPTECARLQGFPDQWARIPWRGKPAEQCPDGPQYKAYGNSMAVPVMRWIGERIKMVLEWRAAA